MPRPKPSDRKVRSLLRKLERVAAQGSGERTTGWEKQFLAEVSTRLKTYGSAFADQTKGDLDESLSYRQDFKLVEIQRMIRHREKRTSSRTAKGRRA